MIDDSPFAGCDGCDAAELFDELVPSVFDGIENISIGVEHLGREIVVAQELPDVFCRIELRRCRRQRQERKVARKFELFRRVPASFVSSIGAADATSFNASATWLAKFF